MPVNVVNNITVDITKVSVPTDAEFTSHTGNTSNPHSVTATQVGALASIDGVSNAGGNIDLIAGANITITPDDTANTITIAATGGGVTSVGATAPITSTGGATPNIGISITTTNDGGAVVKQAATPGTQQSSANFNISGKGKAGQLEAVSVNSVAVKGETSGLGVAVQGIAVNAVAANFVNNSSSSATVSASNIEPSGKVITVTSGSGSGAVALEATSSTGTAVKAVSTTGKALDVDTGNATAMTVDNNSADATAVFTNAGSGAQIRLTPGGGSFPSGTAGDFFIFSNSVVYEYIDSTRGWAQITIPRNSYANRITTAPQEGMLSRFTDRGSALYEYLANSNFANISGLEGYYKVGIGLDDTFTRANSTTIAGRAESGQSWYPAVGTWGISSNKLYTSSDADNDVILADSGTTEPVLQVTENGSHGASAYRMLGVCFRGLDFNTHLEVDLYNGDVRLIKWDAGVQTILTTAAQTTTDGLDYVITIVNNYNTINVYVDGTLKIGHTLASSNYKYLEYTKVGARLYKGTLPPTNASLDNFKVREKAI